MFGISIRLSINDMNLSVPAFDRKNVASNGISHKRRAAHTVTIYATTDGLTLS